jgi:Uma2 family endonuclease
MSSNPVSYVSPVEYLERERLSDERHEYVYGEIVAVARPSLAHGVIVNNTAYQLRVRMSSKGCRVFHENARISVRWGELMAYPDVVLLCGNAEYVDDKHDTLTNPKFIVEVLSPSTKDYDRGTKARLYWILPSMSEYLFIDPTPVNIEHWRRLPTGNWEVAIIRDREATLRLESLGCEIPVSEIYEDVEQYL